MTENTVATSSANAPQNNVRSMVESSDFKSAVASALPAHLTPDRFVRIALTAMTRTPKIMDCTKESVFQCLLLLSQFGLEPDGRNAHLIPFGNACTLIIDYKGLVDLAMRSGKVATIHADKVCENDEFEYNKGVVTKHVVNLRADRGKAYAYYAMVRNKDGSEKYEAMTIQDVQKIRERSRARNNGPWVTDFDEMAKKTVFRRLSKWIQLSPEYREALEYDMDTFEEMRFENAKPVLARPVIKRIKGREASPGNGDTEIPPASQPQDAQNPNASQESGDKKKPGKLDRKKRIEPPSTERPNEAKLIERLSIGKFTVSQFEKIAIENEWLKDMHGHLVKTLAEVQDEKIADWLDEENFVMWIIAILFFLMKKLRNFTK